MQSTEVAQPFHRDGWVYEEKYDAWRMLAVKESGRVRLVSRNGRDPTKRSADLVAALAAHKAQEGRSGGYVEDKMFYPS